MNGRQISSDDTRAARYVPISILREGNLELDEFFFSSQRLPYYLVRRADHLYDSYPPTAPLLALPVYAAVVWMRPPVSDYFLATALSKLAASIITALAVVFIYLTSLRLLSDGCGLTAKHGRPERQDLDPKAAVRHATMATLALGFGTSLWTTSSQGLTSHTAAVLGLSIAIWATTTGRAYAAGFWMAWAFISRPPLLVCVPALAILFTSDREKPLRTSMRYLTGLITVALPGMLYNHWLFGNSLGGAAARTEFWLQKLGAPGMFSGSLIEGTAGLLFSPSRGLLVYSPIVLLAVIGSVTLWRGSARERTLSAVLTLSALLVLAVYAKFVVWWGGHGYGPRYLTDIMPMIGFLMAVGSYTLARRHKTRKWPRRLVAGLFAYSVLVQVIGGYCYPSSWTTSKDPPYWHRLWSFERSQVVTCLREGPRLDPGQRWLLERLGFGLGANRRPS